MKVEIDIGSGQKVDAAHPMPVIGTFEAPVGGALAAKQDLQTTELVAINTKLAAAAISTTPSPVNALPRATANGATSARVNAAASTNATSLKASAGNIVSIDVFNPAAYDVFLKLYNKASAPTVGTDTPTWTIPIKAGTGFSREFVQGKSFATGIAYAITKLQADSDTTVVVAGDLTGSVDYI
jgi:hypothetical protein